MNYVKQFITHIRSKPTLYFFVFVIIFTVDRQKDLEHSIGPYGSIFSDVQEYYRFLPDLLLDDSPEAARAIHENKRTLGMAMMYAPAFFTGHVIAEIKGEQLNGYSPSYHQALRWGSIIYVLLGLVFLRKVLLGFFKEGIVLITLICIFFGTNLYYYTYGTGEMPHSYLFFLCTLLTWMTFRWIKENRFRRLLWIGLVTGVITWIRPTDVIVVLVPLLFGVSTYSQLKQRLSLLASRKIILAGAFFLFMLPLVVQMVFWKMYIGRFVYYSYGGERFFFGDPQLVNFLFSFRKGWLVYTPMMIFALAGILLSWKRQRDLFLFPLLFTAISIYLYSCWWDWAFGGSFGCRVLIEAYAFLAFPFAVAVNLVWENRGNIVFRWSARIALLGVFAFFIWLNTWQSKLYRAGLIHWSGMNKTTFLFTLSKQEFQESDYQFLNEHFTPPDPQKMIRGERDE